MLGKSQNQKKYILEQFQEKLTTKKNPNSLEMMKNDVGNVPKMMLEMFANWETGWGGQVMITEPRFSYDSQT